MTLEEKKEIIIAEAVRLEFSKIRIICNSKAIIVEGRTDNGTTYSGKKKYLYKVVLFTEEDLSMLNLRGPEYARSKLIARRSFSGLKPARINISNSWGFQDYQESLSASFKKKLEAFFKGDKDFLIPVTLGMCDTVFGDGLKLL